MGSKKFKAKAEPVKVMKEKKDKKSTTSPGFFRHLFASLFNNTAAYEGGRREPWWIAALLFMLSIIIAVVPGMVAVGKTKGSDSLNGNLYHADFGLVKFAESLNTNDVDLLVKEDAVTKKHVLYESSVSNKTFAQDIATNKIILTDDTGPEDFPYFAFTQDRTTTTTNSEGESISTTVAFDYLRVYYTGHLDRNFTVGKTTYKPEHYLATKLAEYKSTLTAETNKDITSHLIIGRETIYLRLFNPNEILSTGSTVISYEGKVNTLPVTMNLRTFATNNVNGETISPANTNYTSEVVANFANMQELAYKEVKTQSFWLQTAVYLIIFTLIGLVMGLIIFISTRGKNNPNHDLKFFEAIRIGAWLLPTPALITLIVGLFAPGFFHMVFIMGLGLRSVWLTMRTLNPRQ